MAAKISQVADSVHGSIQISSLEKCIISTEAFNRLHNIMQNSTAYLTYPSNRTSRFAHSLGVMHLSGKMFFQSIVNAEEAVRTTFFKEVSALIYNQVKQGTYGAGSLKSEIERIMQNDDDAGLKSLMAAVKYSPTVSVEDFILKLLEQNELYYHLKEALYLSSTPVVLEPRFLVTYAILLQAVRCSALLHDVGHPPFSHVAEYALEDVRATLLKKEKMNERETYFMSVLHPAGEADEEKKLHEKMGNRIANRILRNILEKNSSIKDDPLKQLFYLLVQQITIEILKTEEDDEGLLGSLHKIIAGSIDADRLDYVVRDLQNSGFIQGRIDYERLISGFKLVKTQSDIFCFCPSIRALSTIEDFFHLRWFLYRFVIYHHRIVKTDYLLGNAISSLSKVYLNKTEKDSPTIGTSIPSDISGLWRAIYDAWLTRTYFDMIIQWDDAWLQTVLRKEYYQGIEDPVVNDQLEELISNRKKYESLIKRMDDFLEIDQAVLFNLKLEPQLVKALLSQDNEEGNILIQIKNLIQFIEGYQAGDYDKVAESYTTRYGFFLYQLRRLLKVVTTTGIALDAEVTLEDTVRNSKDFFDPLISKCVCEIVNKLGHRDCIVVFKNLGTGLDNEPFVYCEGDQVVNLGDVSTIKTDLDNSRKVFPLFFVYASPSNIIKNKSDLRRQIGKFLAEKISILLNELISKMLLVKEEAEKKEEIIQ